MRPEEQQKLFKRYSQASPKTYRAFGGVGLGVSTDVRLRDFG
jgi:signal transduction histidine kinase